MKQDDENAGDYDEQEYRVQTLLQDRGTGWQLRLLPALLVTWLLGNLDCCDAAMLFVAPSRMDRCRTD